MLQLIPKTNIDFIGKRYLFIGFSTALMLIGIGSLFVRNGIRWGLDFTGGTSLEIKFDKAPSLQDMRKALDSAGMGESEIQSVPGSGIFLIRTKAEITKLTTDVFSEQGVLPAAGGQVQTAVSTAAAGGTAEKSGDAAGKKIMDALQRAFPGQQISLLRKEYVGPSVGKFLIRDTIYAFVLTFVGIIIYVAFRFSSGIWGTAGVIALVHDVFATIGLFSVTNREMTVTIVAALLTIAGYSINDTIVVFDRMREKMRVRRSEDLGTIINQSINETLSRTIITSLTVFLVTLALFFWGGEVIHDFAFAMLFGVAIGTYSSIAVASPIVYEWIRIHSGAKGKPVPAKQVPPPAKKK